MEFKICVALVLLLFCICGQTFWNTVAQPDVTADMCIQQLSAPSNATFQEVRAWHQIQQWIMPTVWGGYIVLLGLMFFSNIKKLCVVSQPKKEGSA